MNRARVRFSDEISRLRAIGFSEFCCYTELLPKYSAITHLLIFVLAKLNREIIQVESPLRLTMSQPILAHRERGAYALVFGMGVKFYTLFTDGTGLISANFPSQPVQDMIRKIYKSAEPRGIEECWQAHNLEVVNFQRMGRVVDNLIRFESYISISRREDTTA